VCSSPLFSNGGGPLHCHVASLLHGIVDVRSSSDIVICQWVVLMTMNDIVCHLIATSLAATWHLLGVRSLAGAGDVALRGRWCCVMCCGGGHGSSTTNVRGGGDGRRWVGVVDDDGGERKREGCGLLSMLMASKSSLGICRH